jgi:two-component system, LytTR family, sensor histidine kinase AlgZ
LHPLLTHWRGLAVYLLAWALAGPALALLLHALHIAPVGAAMPWTMPLCAVFAFMLLATYYPWWARWQPPCWAWLWPGMPPAPCSVTPGAGWA